MQRFAHSYKGNKLPCRTLSYQFHVPEISDAYRYVVDWCRIADGSWKILTADPNAG